MRRSIAVIALALLLVFSFAPCLNAEPAAVRVSVHVNDIQQVSLRTHSFYADMYIGFRWSDPTLRPAKTITWMNPYQYWALITRFMAEEPIRLPNGDLFEWIRVRGEFNVTLPLHDYPFDRQLLVAEFEDRASPRSRLEHHAEAISLANDLVTPGYAIGAAKLLVTAVPGLGAVQTLTGQSTEGFTRVRIEIPARRPFLVYFIKLALPLLLVTACNALALLLPARLVEARIGLGITSLLVMVALHISLNTDLPEIDYLMRLDKLYLISYLFGFGTLASMAWTTRRHIDDLTTEAVRRECLWSLLGLMVMYVCLVTVALTVSRT